MDRDYYTILGVPKTATHADIQEAYRRLVRAYHPDRSGGDTAREFRAVQEAWDTLGDAELRQAYDAKLPGERESIARPASAWSGTRFSQEQVLHLNLWLTRFESAHGGDLELELPAPQRCRLCHGSGQQLARLCPACRGQGHRVGVQPFTLHVPPGLVTGQVLQIPLEHWELFHERLVLHVRVIA